MLLAITLVHPHSQSVLMGLGGHWAWPASQSTGLKFRPLALPPNEVIHTISEIHDGIEKVCCKI